MTSAPTREIPRLTSEACSRNWENRGLNQVSEERKGQVSPSGVADDDDVVRFEPELSDEVAIPRDGVNQGSGERVCNREGGRRGDAVFKGEQAVDGGCLLQ